jgi:hypothetical protein
MIASANATISLVTPVLVAVQPATEQPAGILLVVLALMVRALTLAIWAIFLVVSLVVANNGASGDKIVVVM